jgi:hypothetical protein
LQHGKVVLDEITLFREISRASFAQRIRLDEGYTDKRTAVSNENYSSRLDAKMSLTLGSAHHD